MKFTQIPTTAMEEMQLNAGVLLSNFTPSTAEVSGIIGATTGGIKFSATPTYSDFGEDIDNCPKNMMELKRQESVEVKIFQHVRDCYHCCCQETDGGSGYRHFRPDENQAPQ